MLRIFCGSTLFVLMFIPFGGSAGGSAQGWCGYPAPALAYYYPAPVQWAPLYSPLYAEPCPGFAAPRALVYPQAPARPYATPTPAPPSGAPVSPTNPSPPPMKKVPEAGESRSYFDAYGVEPRTSEKRAGDRCAAGFWN